ncbi:MAG: serine--tRNA ligase [Rhodothermales bacterium]|nr:serine--tRNA ligase [Rhodothermales bacterium]MBO6779816.1 serine--tRNA ligase [Rhodothermales bacterium]
MIDLTLLRENPDLLKRGIRAKRKGDEATVDALLDADTRRRESVTLEQELREQANAAAKSIGELMKSGRRDEAQDQIKASSELKERLKTQEEATRAIEAELHQLVLEIPNPPHESVPEGAGPEDNAIPFQAQVLPGFDFEPKPHWELCATLGLVDFDRGAKVTGAGFPFYLGKGARLQRALIQFFLDQASDAGFVEMQPPIMVNADSATGTGALPDKEAQMYEVPRDDLYLIPTAEVPVTNYRRDEILTEDELPVRYAAYTPCFRREAGSYGKDVRGLNRLHQFDKVEIVQLVRPEDSYDALEAMTEHAEGLLNALGLPFRRLLLCTGDMGITQSKTYDLEVWSAGQERWLEVSSVSNFETFQARRANIRYRPAGGGKPQFVHTLNGSALALPRIMASLLELYQQDDGSIEVPEVLRAYTGFDRIG